MKKVLWGLLLATLLAAPVFALINGNQLKNASVPQTKLDAALSTKIHSQNTDTSTPANFTVGNTVFENQPFSFGGCRVIITNPYITRSNTYKGETHTHATTHSTTQVAEQYEAAGYDFVVITDHDQLSTPPVVAGIVCIPGVEETTDMGHIGVMNATAEQGSTAELPAQQVITTALAQGAFVTLNHPNRLGTPFTQAQLRKLCGYHAIEVWNGKGEVAEGTGNSEDQWDAFLKRSRYCFGTATDDFHDDVQIDSGWVMVHADTCTETSITLAMKQGNFYSTTGPTLTISLAQNVITATTGAAGTIAFIGKGGTVLQSTPSATTADYTVVGDEIYVRVKVTRDSDSEIAWSNPLPIFRAGAGSDMANHESDYDHTGFHTQNTDTGTTSSTFDLPAAGEITVNGAHAYVSKTFTSKMLYPSVTNGCTQGDTQVSVTYNVNFSTSDFVDGDTKFVEGDLFLPDNYSTGTLTYRIEWFTSDSSTNAVVWGVQGRFFGAGSLYNQAFGTASTVTDANTATYANQFTSTVTGLTGGGTPGAGKNLHFRIFRDGPNPADTLTNTAHLIQIIFEIPINAYSE